MTRTHGTGPWRSLRRKLLLPLLATTAVILAVGSTIAWVTSEAAIHERGSINARALATAVAAAAENVGDEADLQRVVLAIAADDEVELIVVIAGAEPRVIACSRSDWRGRRIQDIDELKDSLEIRDALVRQQTSTSFHRGGIILDVTQPVRLDLHHLIGLKGSYGAIMLHLDTRPMRRQVFASAVWISTLAVGGIAWLAIVALVLVRRHVDAPLRLIEAQLLPMERQFTPIDAGRAYDDEIGIVVAALNRSIEEVSRHQHLSREVSERLSIIVETAPHGIALADPSEPKVTAMNDAMARLFGYTRTEFEALPLLDLHPPDAHELVVKQIQRIIDGDMEVARAIPCRHRDGHVFYCDITPSVVHFHGRAKLIAYFTDVTQEHLAREAMRSFNLELERRVTQRTRELEARTREFEAVVQSIPDSVIRFDPSGSIVFCKPADDLQSTLSRECQRGSSCVSGKCRFEPMSRLALELGARAQTAGASAIGETELDDRTIELRVATLENGDYLALIRDITARRRLERETEAALEMERNLSKLKSQFISVASHEFRTPLTAIAGSAELLSNYAERLSSEKRRELLLRIVTGVNRLTDIINDTLTLSRVDSGRVPVRPEDVDIARLLQTIVDELLAADETRHRIHLHHSDTSTIVQVDTSIVQHIVTNLLTNAIRYSPPESTIDVKLEVAPETLAITVADEGIGIDPTDRAHLFEPFFRGRNVGRIPGTGLGLNIVLRYAELLGGRVELLPSERGATFRCTLPHPTKVVA